MESNKIFSLKEIITVREMHIKGLVHIVPLGMSLSVSVGACLKET